MRNTFSIVNNIVSISYSETQPINQFLIRIEKTHTLCLLLWYPILVHGEHGLSYFGHHKKKSETLGLLFTPGKRIYFEEGWSPLIFTSNPAGNIGGERYRNIKHLQVRLRVKKFTPEKSVRARGPIHRWRDASTTKRRFGKKKKSWPRRRKVHLRRRVPSSSFEENIASVLLNIITHSSSIQSVIMPEEGEVKPVNLALGWHPTS